MCKTIFSDSQTASNLRLYRTNYTEIVREVVSPHFINQTVKNIREGKYSLILDESTDISVTKMLGVVVRYLRHRIVFAFLGLVPVKSATARDLATALINYLNKLKINLKNLVALGTDNASVMTGTYNGLFTILKNDVDLPNLVLIRCTCHSLQLAVSHASEGSLPTNIEFLIREIYNWFSLSPTRQEEYKAIYKTINLEEGPLKILKMCSTRWLSIEPAIRRIVSRWDELKLHFEIAKQKNNCYTAEMLFAMFEDIAHYLYLVYLQTILGEVQHATKIFESQNTDPIKLYETLDILWHSLSKRMIYPHVKTQCG